MRCKRDALGVPGAVQYRTLNRYGLNSRIDGNGDEGRRRVVIAARTRASEECVADSPAHSTGDCNRGALRVCSPRMATCPRCGGFLHDNHRCRGRWRRLARTASWTGTGLAAGGASSFLFTEQPAVALIATCGVLGVVLVTAVRRFAKF